MRQLRDAPPTAEVVGRAESGAQRSPMPSDDQESFDESLREARRGLGRLIQARRKRAA